MEYDNLCESYLTMKTKMFYPRNLKLSPEFVEAFSIEVKRLLAEGENKKTIHTRVAKALRFHL